MSGLTSTLIAENNLYFNKKTKGEWELNEKTVSGRYNSDTLHTQLFFEGYGTFDLPIGFDKKLITFDFEGTRRIEVRMISTAVAGQPTPLGLPPVPVPTEPRPDKLRSPEPKELVNLPSLEGPKGIVSVVGQGLGVSNTALIFGSFNDYKTNHPFEFTNNKVVLTPEFILDPVSLARIREKVAGVLIRARSTNPLTDRKLREPQYFVFAINSTKCCWVMTDGLSYAEAKIGTYTLAGGLFIPTFDDLPMTPIVDPTENLSGISRSSHSGDNVTASFLDVFITAKTNENVIVINRPYGDLNGWLSFKTDASVTTLVKDQQQPALLYKGERKIDLVQDVLPPIPFKKVGVFVNDITSESMEMKLIDADTTILPYAQFEFPREHTFTLPTGARFVLAGSTYELNTPLSIDYSIKRDKFIYLRLEDGEFSLIPSKVMREPNNYEVQVGKNDWGISMTAQYIVFDNKLFSSVRRGQTIPVFEDDGELGVNTYFKVQDVII